MKTIRDIYFRDLKHIFTNWAALIVITGLVFLPSLYAWFNIEASWDPYGQTGGLAVAVSNNDAGSVIRAQPINIGEEIIASLRDNRQIGWIFVDEPTALRGVQHGDYYASITIPSDFSEKIASILTDHPQKAEIEYTVNEKINAISPKITSKGASGIIEEVSRNFIKIANGTIFQIFNEIGVTLESELPTIEQLRSLVFKLEAMFPEIWQTVATAAEDLSKANEIVLKAQENVPIVAQLAKDGQDFTERLGQFLDRSRENAAAAGPSIKNDLALLQQTATATEQLTALLLEEKPDPAAVKSALDRASRRLALAIDITDKTSSLFARLNSMVGGNRLAFVTDRLGQIKTNFEQQAAAVNRIREVIDKGEKPADDLVQSLNQLSKDASAWIGDLLNRYDSEIQPLILEGLNKARTAAEQAHTVLTEASRSIPDVQKIINDAAAGLAFGGRELQAVQQHLPVIEARIKALADLIRQLESEGNLSEIIDLLKHNAEEESSFFAEPVVLKENKLFPIPNYGSAMSPFFTTLSLWVGALLLVSLLTVEVHHPELSYKSYQIYFGRYLTFMSIAVLQSLMVTLGDLFLLGTYCVNKDWFVFFGALLSAVFMLIVYTLVSVFGNIGKALAIVLLVLQLAGSGGTFPIQVTPPFFQAIHPYLPFTYAISMMREAVGGILWDIILLDLRMMAAYVGITLLIGLALKKSINRASQRFIKKAQESELIH